MLYIKHNIYDIYVYVCACVLYIMHNNDIYIEICVILVKLQLFSTSIFFIYKV